MHTLHRQIITIKGTEDECHALLQKRLNPNQLNILTITDLQKSNHVLGQEFDVLIVTLDDSFNANTFGATVGTIRGGGALILLLTEPNAIKQSLFLTRFYRLLNDANLASNFLVIDAQLAAPSFTIKPLTKSNDLTQANADQEKIIEAISHVVTGHRKRPLLISADRGRGKSAALGMASARLIGQGLCQHISVCAPSKKSAEFVFLHAGDAKQKLHFFAPDVLLKQTVQTDLLIIDEAAAIPLPLLSQLLDQFPRLVFATTLHGYEGSGRAFATRFQTLLDNKAPGWTQSTLTHPIRWAENDPLEQFTFQTLLLDAEPAVIDQNSTIDLADCEISTLAKTDLISDEAQLTELFGLLVAAHYQTKPSDLQQLLDDETMQIIAVQYQHQIIATALLATEGGLDPALAADIFAGARRPKGNLVAQALASQVGIEDAPCLIGERIVRLAVHPDLQRQGFGSALVNHVISQSQADYVSTSFGASDDLLAFWGNQPFLPVHVGVKRDASSGAHSVIFLHGKTEDGNKLVQQASTQFVHAFPHLLCDTLRDLESTIVKRLMPLNATVKISAIEKQIILAFATQHRSYENSLAPLWKLICFHGITNIASKNKPDLTEIEQDILVLKILQKHSWAYISKQHKPIISGKKQGISLLRSAIKKLTDTVWF